MLLFKYFSEKWIVISVVFIYVIICFVVLPQINKKNFFIFYTWSMFSDSYTKKAIDIVWESKKGREYFLRDHRYEGQKAGINVSSLFALIQQRDLSKIKSEFYDQLVQYCKCQKIDLIQFSGSTSEHLLFKKNLAIKKKISL